MADFSSSKKKALKKNLERTSRLTDRSQNNFNLVEQNEEKSSTDPYQCTGKFLDDFQNLCKQNQIGYVPQITSRARRALTPTLTDTSKERMRAHKRGTHSNFDSQSMTQSDLFLAAPSQKQPSITTLNEQSDESKELDSESMPKTFVLTKDRFEYFKPKLQVEYDHPEKTDHISELFIRGWKVDTPIINILQQCLPHSEKLITLNFWYCGLNDEAVEILAGFLPKCPNLKNLSLDGNPVTDENFYKLISGESLIQSLSLRNCQISDAGAEKIGQELGTVSKQNKKLLVLNLSANRIGDPGAIEIAKGLRTNRTLLVLNLSGNCIGDLGACKFAETFSRFKLSHEEIVRRRSMKREQFVKEMSPASRKTKSENERPPSMAQTKTFKEATLSKTKKERLESSTSANRDKSKSKDATLRETSNEKQSGPKSKKEKESNSSILLTSTLQKKDKGKDVGGSISSDKNKSLKNKSSKTKLRDSDTENENVLKSSSGAKISSMTHVITSESDPLMEDVEAIEGELWLTGNRTLISLNLSRNKISLISVKEFLLCIQYQTSINFIYKSAYTNGLLRLNLNKNEFPANDQDHLKLIEMIKSRDPMSNKDIIVEKDTISVISRDGKETSRSKSGLKH